MIVDAHQHFWRTARGDYGWLKPDSPLSRDFVTDDLRPLLLKTGIDATILVQAAPTAAETDFLLAIAQKTPWVLGVVGWIDLAGADAADEIRRRAADPLFLGVRPMLQDLPDPDWILGRNLAPALDCIAAEGLVFDALVLSHQIDAITELARRHGQLPIMLDHGAKPRLGDAGAMAIWARDMAGLAAEPNVTCKLSGLLTELQPGAGPDDVKRAVAILYDLFGPQRLVWGSDWPVLTRAGAYTDWFELAREAVAARESQAVRAVMGANALRIYRPARHTRA